MAEPGGVDAIATVDGEPIPVNVFNMYVTTISTRDKIDRSTPQGAANFARMRQFLIGELIDRKLIENEARARGLEPDSRLLSEAYQRWIDSLGGAEAYQAFLDHHVLTDKQFRGSLAQEFYGVLLKKSLTEDVSDADVKAFSERERNNPAYKHVFYAPEEVRAAHIMIAANPDDIRTVLKAADMAEDKLDAAVEKEMDKRRELAVTVQEQAASGEDFAKLASTHSNDRGSLGAGGDLGFFVRGAHVQAFDDAAFALEPGQISGVVETPFGFHIIKAIDKTPPRARDADEIEAQVRNLVRDETGVNWLKKARAEADITIHDDELAKTWASTTGG